MSGSGKDFLALMRERGFIHQCTDEAGLAQCLGQQSVTAYIGYDATADSLHVGNLSSIMFLRWWQRAGHRPIILLGGGTTKVGDPSGRDEVRTLLSPAEIERNSSSLAQIFTSLLNFAPEPDATNTAIFVNNADWLDKLEWIPFLREYGRHFSINRMLSMDSVRLRLEREQPLSFLEFNYMVLQAYDFLELARQYDCQVQIGGSDQWGNIITGIDLARRCDSIQLYGLTLPLLTTASGVKMGKTIDGAVWLARDRLAPSAYWQFWRNAEDADTGWLLRIFTELDLGEIRRLEKLGGSERNIAKKILANEATSLLHGSEAARQAEHDAAILYEGAGDRLDDLDLPRLAINTGKGKRLVELLVEAGLASSRSDARRHMQGGAVRLGEQRIEDSERLITSADFLQKQTIRLSVGRKRHALLVKE